MFIDASLEFPWDTQRSLELAFYRTYAVPSIATLLDSTGEFTERAQKRYDDTQILISAFCYVLSTMVFEPIRWNARFGRRLLAENEKLATFWFWGEVGKRMAIRDIPVPHPSPALRRSVEAGVRARSRFVGLLPPPRKPRLRTLERHRSYPQGHRIEELGPVARPGAKLSRRGPVAQRTEREPSKLRAVVRFHPGP